MKQIIKKILKEETSSKKLFTITGILSTYPDRLLTNIGGKDTYIKLKLNIGRDKCGDCTLPIGKEITVQGYTENGSHPSSSNELIVDESGFPRGNSLNFEVQNGSSDFRRDTSQQGEDDNRNRDKEPTETSIDNTPSNTIYHISMGENWDKGYDHKSDLFFKDYDKAVEYLTSNGYEKNDYPFSNSNEERWSKGYGYQAKLTKQKLIV